MGKFRPKTLLLVSVIVCSLAASAALYSASVSTVQPEPGKAHHHVTKRATTATSRQPMPLMSLEPSEPLSIAIASQRIQAAVEKVGLTETGEMAAPEGAGSVGWYRHGYLPGSVGNAVLAGHLMHKDGRGAFYALQQVAIGDEIIITTKKSAQHYRAVSFKRYDASATALAEVFGNSGKSRLSLITCSGSWDEVKQRYSERYVVFADFTHEEHL